MDEQVVDPNYEKMMEEVLKAAYKFADNKYWPEEDQNTATNPNALQDSNNHSKTSTELPNDVLGKVEEVKTFKLENDNEQKRITRKTQCIESQDIIFKGCLGGEKPTEFMEREFPNALENFQHFVGLMVENSLKTCKELKLEDTIRKFCEEGTDFETCNEKITELHKQVNDKVMSDPELGPMGELLRALQMETIICGSAAEKTTISKVQQGTDLDVMFVFSVLPGKVHDIVNQPGYVNVKLYPSGYLFPQDKDGFLLSSVVQSFCLHRSKSLTSPMLGLSQGVEFLNSICGPAIGSTFPGELHKAADLVQAFRRRDQWPKLATEWLTRKRPSGWPTKDLIKQALEKGTVVVPATHPKSPNPDIEFRYSFSETEVLLMCSLSRRQRKCFCLAKLIRKLVFGEFELLTTYHVKTVFFWMLEQLPTTFWETQDDFGVLDHILEKLIFCCAKGTMSHYFIREANILEHIPRDHLKTCAQQLIYVKKYLPVYIIQDIDFVLLYNSD